MKEPIFPYNIKKEVHKRLDIFEGLFPELKRILSELQEEDLQIQYKSSEIDLVTKADFLSEQTIIHFLQSRFPEDSILSEETGKKEAMIQQTESVSLKPSLFTWCIDPLDGTVNYAHKIPLFSISIGLLYDDFPVGGLVFIPEFNDIYRAVYKDGALKNHKPISVSTTKEVGKSLIVTGFPYNRKEFHHILISAFDKVLQHCRGVRRTGSAALDLCWLAEGRLDGHYEWNLSPWDTTAGIVIVKEAGGIISNEKKESYTPGDSLMIASNPYIHEQLLEILLKH